MSTSTLDRITKVPLAELIPAVRPGFAVGERDSCGVIQVRMNNVDLEGKLDLDDVIRVPATSKQVADCSLSVGDVLFNNTNSMELVGKSALFRGHSEPVTFSNHFTRLRVNQRRLEPRYLARWLTRQQKQRVFEGLCTRWVGQSAVRTDKLLALKIPLPPLPEQKRIAEILDKADVIRRKRRELMTICGTAPTAAFLDMFGDPHVNPNGWPTKQLKELVAASDKINYGVVQPGVDFPGGIPIVRVGDLQNLRVSVDELKRIDPVIEKDYARSRLVGDEILIACVGSIGLIALADDRVKGFNIVRAVARIRCSNAIDRLYLASYLASSAVQSYFHRATRTVSQPTLNIKQIEETPVLVPPIAMQRKFAAVVTRQERFLVRLETAASEANELFDALVQRAFRGEL